MPISCESTFSWELLGAIRAFRAAVPSEAAKRGGDALVGLRCKPVGSGRPAGRLLTE